MPKWRELRRFCERDGWELYKDTEGNMKKKSPQRIACGVLFCH